MNITIENGNQFISTIKNSFAFLPAFLIKSIVEEKIKSMSNEQSPITFTIKACCLYIDISKLFEESSTNLNKNETSNSSTFNYTKNLNIPEYYYFFFNRFQEKLISVINNHGGDIIFEGLGVYAIWPPEKKEDEDENKEEIINIYLRTILCALDLQKKALKTDFSNNSLFFPKIGISFGDCKFILLRTESGKYEYTAYGDALLDSFDCSQKVTKKGQIITNSKMFEDISKYIEYNFVGAESKYISITSLKNIGNLLKNNKSTVNLIRNNLSFEQMFSKKDIFTNFNYHLSSDTLQKSMEDEKWFKEIRYMTLLFVRIKMSQKDYDSPKQIQKIFLIIYNVSKKYGGIINKILTDKNGFIYLISFGVKSHKNSEIEIRGVLSAFEISKKLKMIKVKPYIGITSGFSFYGLIGIFGGRREMFIISGLLFIGLLSMDNAENVNEKDDNILVDENTMHMIDSKIPSKFWKKLKTLLGIDINLFIPKNIENILNEHYETNLFPLIGTHLHDKDDSSYDKNAELIKEDNIIFLEEEHLRNIVKIMNDFTLNRTNIKLINITSVYGCGKTLLLKKCLETYFEANPKLRETLIINNDVKEYPFVINANLTFVINSDILISYHGKDDFRGIQFILKIMLDIIYKDNEGEKKIKKYFNQNNEIENYMRKLISFGEEGEKNLEEYNEYSSFKEDSFVLTKENKKKLYQLFILIIKEYKKILNNVYRDVLYETNLYMPLIIIIEDINISDDLTIEFIKYYLSSEYNDFLLITTNSIPIYPPYVYLEPYQKDPFYDLKNNKSIEKFKIELLDNDEKKIIFVKSILKELRGIKISSISPKLLAFLVNKTFGGNQLLIMRLILIIIEQNYYKIENEKLIENETFEKMLRFNDFTEFPLSRIIQRKIGEIISNELDEEEVCLLKIASLFGDLFELSQIKQVILIDNTSIFLSYLRKGEDQYIYKKLRDLEAKYIIEIIEDLDLKNKYVICKFSIPFLREILYQRIPSEQRNQLHYIIGKMTKVNFIPKYGKRSKYLSNDDELDMLKNHLKFSEITIHENFLKGTLSSSEMENDNLNINNLKTLLTQEICLKISSIKINDDKNNMIKAGYIYKKSDGKLTWEYRYFVLTTNRVVYYYNDEDYKKEDIPPLGIFYLQNLFSVNLLTDGYVGGKKNIFSLSVNEWIKKGNYMTPRIYYLSIENREELYKWIITFNILKIKAFYDNYSQNFGYVNFPLYNKSKGENAKFSFKPKKIIKFDYELYKDIYLKKKEEKDNKKKNDDNKSFLYNNYFLREENDDKKEDDMKIMSLAQEMLIKIKYLVKYSLPIYLSNIQLSLIKNPISFNKSSSNLYSEIEFKTPKYIECLKKKNLKGEIKIIDEKLNSNNRLHNDNVEKFTSQEKRFFSQYYPNYIYQKENKNKISFQVKNIKKYIQKKHVEKTKYKLFGPENKKIDVKSEWKKYFDSDKNYFKNFQEEKIETTDNLRYTDFIEKYDLNGNLKDRPSVLFRQSISSKVASGSNKNENNNPILGKLISRHNEYQRGSDAEDDINYDDNFDRNENSNKDDERYKDSNPINNKNSKEEINENRDSNEDYKDSIKSDKNDNTKDTEKNKKSKKEKSKDKNTEDTLEKKEKLKNKKQDKNDSNLLELVSDKNKNKDKKENTSSKKRKKLNDNNFDLAKEIKKSYIISNKNIAKNIITSESSEAKSKKKKNAQLNIKMGSLNSLFSFGENQNNIFDLNKNTQKNQNQDSNSLKYQDSNLVNSSKSEENESSKVVKNTKSNEEESISDENNKNSNNERDSLMIQNKLFGELNKKDNENEIKISFNSNNKNNNADILNINSINTEKLSENYEINKINENKINSLSKNSMNSNSKQNSNIKYNYLNDLSPNRKFIINIKLKEKYQNEKSIKENEKNSNKKSTESDAFEKLRDINICLDNEKSLSSYFKRINKENTAKNIIKNNSRNRNANSSKYTQEMTVQSTNSNYDNIFYPNVYYINDKNNFHTKTHVSMLFTNLKNQNNIINQEENN